MKIKKKIKTEMIKDKKNERQKTKRINWKKKKKEKNCKWFKIRMK